MRARLVLFLLALPALTAAASAGCSEGAATAPGGDAGPDGTPPLVDSGASDASGGGRNCEADRSPDGLAAHLDCAGLYEDFASKKVAPNTRAFRPGVEFWSDGASKARFVHLPSGAKIDSSKVDEWSFPVGTRFWKEFKLEGRRIETRLFEKTASGWRHATYRWNGAETEATRMEAGERILRPGQAPYEIPKADDCMYCHAGRAEPVLGFEPLSLGLPNATGVTLNVLAAEGLLSAAPSVTTFSIPDDGTERAAPAIAWLHANCGHCHNETPSAGAAGAALRMIVRPSHLVSVNAGSGDGGATSLPVYATGVCKPSERDAPGGGKYLYIAGGAPSESLAAILLGSRSEPGTETIVSQMPPIVSHTVDVAGKKLVDEWIAALPPCP